MDFIFVMKGLSKFFSSFICCIYIGFFTNITTIQYEKFLDIFPESDYFQKFLVELNSRGKKGEGFSSPGQQIISQKILDLMTLNEMKNPSQKSKVCPAKKEKKINSFTFVQSFDSLKKELKNTAF